MVEENISQEFRSKNINETRNYFINEIDQNELMSTKNKKVCTTLNHIENVFTLVYVVAGCILISALPSLLGIAIGTTSSATGLRICAIL